VQILSLNQAIPAADMHDFTAWCNEFLIWLQQSTIGQDENDAENNHGVWFDAIRLSMALATRQMALAEEIMNSAQKRLQIQMDTAGFFPLEMTRTLSFHYSVFIVEGFLKIAAMGKRTQTSLWNYAPSGKQLLPLAVDNLLPYLQQSATWPGKQIKAFDVSEAYSFLSVAANQFNHVRSSDYLNRQTKLSPEKLYIYSLTQFDL
ncbi:MAG: hypothetical protein FGM61_12925, partial [Sediminibacterium sp.]|nr:hypothetical protein [Sediminibacterium sp.]